MFTVITYTNQEGDIRVSVYATSQIYYVKTLFQKKERCVVREDKCKDLTKALDHAKNLRVSYQF